MYFGLQTRLREFFVKSSSWTLRVLRKRDFEPTFGSTGRVHKCVETRIPCPRFPVASFFPDSPLAGVYMESLPKRPCHLKLPQLGLLRGHSSLSKKRNAKIIHAMMVGSAKLLRGSGRGFGRSSAEDALCNRG